MQTKKQLKFLTLGAAITLLIGVFGLCQPDGNMVCQGMSSDIGTALMVFSASVIISLVPLFFLKDAIYKTWRTFAMMAIPLALVLIFITPEYDRSIYSITREYVTFLVSGAFLAISYLIILIQHFRTK